MWKFLSNAFYGATTILMVIGTGVMAFLVIAIVVVFIAKILHVLAHL